MCRSMPSRTTREMKKPAPSHAQSSLLLRRGDFTNRNGTGGKSIYGSRFPVGFADVFLCRVSTSDTALTLLIPHGSFSQQDENFQLKHEGKGILSMGTYPAPSNATAESFFCVVSHNSRIFAIHAANAGPNTNGCK